MSRRGFHGFASMFLSILLMAGCFAQTPKFTISTVAGTGVSGFSGDGGQATAATLGFPAGIAFDSAGNMFIADSFNNRIRKVDANGAISTVAGTGSFGFSGDSGAATAAAFNRPYGVAFDKAGNMYIADTHNDVVRKVAASGSTITTIAGRSIQGLGGDGGAATGALLDTPTALALDAAGNLYIADTNNNRIRKVGTDGTISTFAGSGGASSIGDGGPATSANLNHPEGIAIDQGNVYVADTFSHRVRKISPDGTITTVAGNGSGGKQGDGGPATKASLYYPKGLAVDPLTGNLYIADSLNSRIRVVTPDGNIYTAAGNGGFDYQGDGGPATTASLRFPWGLAVGAGGKVYVADDQNSSIRLLTPVGPLVSATPKINAGGVQSAAAFGGFSSVAPGSWIEIHGLHLAAHERDWTPADFDGGRAPTSLDGTAVTIGGQAAFIAHISPDQINAQIPSNVALGSQELRVITPAGASDPQTITVNEIEPGLLAPESFKLGDKQYAQAFSPDGTALELPARPGDTIVLYGVGFGPVTPDASAGDVVQRFNSLVLPFQVFLGGTPAELSYAGLAPGKVGLYQFNIVVPDTAPGDAVPLTFSLGTSTGQQVLYAAVQK